MGDDNPYKVHLGCGPRTFGASWEHIDGGVYPHVRSHDIQNLPFGDATASIVYASHVIEYFDRNDVLDVLREWKRVLMPGGILRVAVPDFAVMVKLYQEGLSLYQLLGPLYGRMDMAGTMIYHKTVYDFDSLQYVLTCAGFENVRLYDWRHTEHAHVDDHSQAYIPHMDKENGTLISLNVEATKP